MYQNTETAGWKLCEFDAMILKEIIVVGLEGNQSLLLFQSDV